MIVQWGGRLPRPGFHAQHCKWVLITLPGGSPEHCCMWPQNNQKMFFRTEGFPVAAVSALPFLSPSLMQTQAPMVIATSHERCFLGRHNTVPMCMAGTCLGGPRLVMPEASYEFLERAGRKWLALARNIGPHLGDAVLGGFSSGSSPACGSSLGVSEGDRSLGILHIFYIYVPSSKGKSFSF